LIEHLVALVEDELANVTELQVLVANKGIETTWSRNDDVWVSLLVSQDLDVLVDLSTAVEDAGLDIWQVLAEALILGANLIGQLTSVAHDQD
jgi:hypothetical protein